MKLGDEIKGLFTDGQEWLKLQIEYSKYTLAEKITILLSTLALGAVCLLLSIVALILLSFALVHVFELFIPSGFAYLSVAGILLLLVLIVYLLRKPLLLNPIARLISRLIIGNTNK